jgi:hypothetical protein
MAFYGAAGQQFRVNGARAGNQYVNASAPLEDGGFVIVWTSFVGGSNLVKAQRYDSAGLAVGGELLVTSAGTPGWTMTSSAAGLEGGGFVIAWESPDTTKDGSGSAILARMYDSAGQAVGSEFVLNNEGAGNQSAAALVGLADGSFLATWTTSQPAPGGTLSEVKGRLFDASGIPVGAEFLLNTTVAGAQSQPAVAANPAGGFVAAWRSDPNSGDIYAQRFDSAGAKVGGEFIVNSTTAGSQGAASVTILSDGRIAIVWTSAPPTGYPQTVKGQLFDSSGVAIGGEFTVTDPNAPSQTFSPQVKALPDGGFVATWTHVGTNTLGNYARLYDSAGTPSASFMVNSAADLFENDARTVVTAGGDIVVAWTTSSDVVNTDISARIIALNKAPVIQSDGGGATASFTVAEDQQVVTQVVATDRIGPAPVAYSIVGGADAALFAIDSTGHLTFLAAPDAGAPADSDLDNVYEVVVSAGDGELSDTQALSVTVAATGRGLIIASSAQAAALENATAVARVSATDAAATFAITGGADSAHFTIDSATGLLSFVAAPNFEAPADSGANNVYDVEVTATAAGQSVAQTLSVKVANVNEGAAFTTSATPSIIENSTTLAIAAADTEGDPVIYRIVGGADSDKMNINATTGVLSFYGAPNFEAPNDVGSNGVYDVIVQASDGDLFVTQAFAIAIANVNEGAMISSNGAGATAAFSIAENQPVATTVVGRDNPAGTTIVYAIAGGSDSSRFTINAQTGVLSFVSGPNFDSPNDSNYNNVYEVTVSATDGTVTDTQALLITVTNVNEPITIVSEGGGDSAAFSLAENGGGFTVVAADQDAGTPTFSIIGGADAARFQLNTVSGKTGWFGFVSPPNFEAPTDSNGDNVYELVVQVSDGLHVDVQTLNITVTNLQETVFITSNGSGSSASITLAENQSAATVVAATDPDNAPIVYSISGGVDSARFAIDSATGALTFVTAPDYENPNDSGANRTYDVIVRASDGVTSDTQALAISISNVIEPFAITTHGGGDTGSLLVNEGGTSTFTVATNESASLTFSLSGADAARFTILAGSGGSRTIGFLTSPNYEAPTDAGGNNVYDVVVTVSGGGYSDSQALAISVANVNEAPVITSDGGGASAFFSRAENGAAVTTVVAADPENGALTYSIWGGADAAKFTIDSATGVLAFIAAPDFETPADAGFNNVYDLIVLASDGVFSDSQSVSVTLTNVEEGGPAITSNGGGASASVSVAENTSAVTTVAASQTPPVGGAISYSIAGGVDSAKFTIDSATGALAFVSAPNFEVRTDTGANGVYDVIVKASDGVNSDIQSIAVTVTNVNEAPVITSGGGGDTGSLSAPENSLAAGTITSTDPENTARSYSIIGGADSAKFTINSVTGALSFVTAANYEAPADADLNNVYEVVVRASDGVFADTQTVNVTIVNFDEAPVITSNGAGTSASLSLAENSTLVTTVAASDPENFPIAYSISGGADSSKFTINASTGALSFVTAPNFESKTDVGANGIYDVIVRASDGFNVDTQAIAVTVTNVNEAPVITSNGGGATASVSFSENGATVTIVTSTDPEGTARTYSIAGGADAARFAMSSNGILSFVAAPDFENPTDVGGNNVYDVVIRASDGVLDDTQAMAITVTNLNEAPVITSNGAGNTGAVTVSENVAFVTTVTSTDPENATRTYSISGGTDSAKFAINASTGVLSFVASPNFESPTDFNADNQYLVMVRSSDGFFTDDQYLTVTVANVNEAPVITSNGGGASASVQVDENGLAVATVQSSDPDGGARTYAIAGGADAALFSIDSATGALAFLSAPDYEAPADSGADNVYEVTVSASDGSLLDLQALSVSIGDLFEGGGQAPLAWERWTAADSPAMPVVEAYYP